MARKKKVEFILSKIKLEFVCSTCGKVECEVSVNDFSAIDQECEICGSHGDITVSVNCPVCKNHSTIELQGW